MKRADALCLRLGLFAVIATGLWYGWMRWFAGADQLADPEAAIAAAAWEGDARRCHLLAGALAVFAVGLVWRTHVLAKRRERAGRRTGMAVAALTLLTAGSGHVLQAVDDADARRWLGVGHAIVGLVLLAAYVSHRLAVRSSQRQPSGISPSPSRPASSAPSASCP